MRAWILLLGFVVSGLAATAAESASPTKSGRLTTVRLLPVNRLEPKSDASSKDAAPDGLVFHFVVLRKPEAVGPTALKETRDFTLGGESYQKKTSAELGKSFEPSTVIENAEKFFEQYPQFNDFAPKDRKAAAVISVSIGGAKLEAGAKVEVTLTVGAGKQVEPFTYAVVVPEKQ
jgi:hypothetical protein